MSFTNRNPAFRNSFSGGNGRVCQSDEAERETLHVPNEAAAPFLQNF